MTRTCHISADNDYPCRVCGAPFNDDAVTVRRGPALDVGRLASLPTFRAIVDETPTLESYEEVAEIIAREYAKEPR